MVGTGAIGAAGQGDPLGAQAPAGCGAIGQQPDRLRRKPDHLGVSGAYQHRSAVTGIDVSHGTATSVLLVGGRRAHQAGPDRRQRKGRTCRGPAGQRPLWLVRLAGVRRAWAAGLAASCAPVFVTAVRGAPDGPAARRPRQRSSRGRARRRAVAASLDAWCAPRFSRGGRQPVVGRVARRKRPAVGQDFAHVVEDDHSVTEQAPALLGVEGDGMGGVAVRSVSGWT